MIRGRNSLNKGTETRNKGVWGELQTVWFYYSIKVGQEVRWQNGQGAGMYARLRSQLSPHEGA